MTTCPVCTLEVRQEGYDKYNDQYRCARCGNYSLSGSAEAILLHRLADAPKARAILSHAIRQMQRTDSSPLITSSLADEILRERTLPKPTEQAANFLLWLGSTAEAADSVLEIKCEMLQAIIGGREIDSVYYVLNHLQSSGLIQYHQIDYGKLIPTLKVQMTFQGWDEHDRLQREQVESKTVFMAMKFGVEELNKVVNEVFRPAVDATGFTLRVLTDVPRAGLIDDRLRVEIRRSRFLIADITHSNLGAYWEAGFAEGLGKPVIYTCKSDVFRDVAHFDTNHHLTVLWSDDLQRTAEDLKATIRATFPTEAKLDD